MVLLALVVGGPYQTHYKQAAYADDDNYCTGYEAAVSLSHFL